MNFGAGLSSTKRQTEVCRTSCSDIEPRRYPDVFDREHQTQEKLHRQSQQNTDRKELKSQILKKAGICQQLCLKRIGNLRPFQKLLWRFEITEFERAALHQPVEKQSRNNIKGAHDDAAKDHLGDPVGRQESESGYSRDDLM